MKTLPHFFVVALALFLAGCVGQQTHDDAFLLVSKINNADVQWDGNLFGLKPTLTGPTQKLAIRHDNKTIPVLMDALKDENRFVAAHVLLSGFSGFSGQGDEAFWNGLHITLLPNGQVSIHAGQQAALLRQWTDWRSK